jgi:predicted MFS family arabinose efflux permease
MTSPLPSPRLIVPALGITQILAWGSSYYLPTVLAKPIAADTGWPLTWVVAGLSIGLLIAGLVSPLVGRKIHALGGRSVLAASAILIALGQITLALSPNLAIFIAGWIVLGFGMSAGLYDAAFSTLGRLYGPAARHHITTLTLFGGLASTVCWPLSAFLVEHFGWRGACAVYAAIHLGFSLPVHLLTLRRGPLPDWNGEAAPQAGGASAHPRDGRTRMIFLILAAAIMIASMLSTVISVHILTILQSKGIALAAAVALGTLIGPAQVGARFIEMLVSRYHHPIWTKVTSVVFVATGLGLLWADLPIIPLALVFYGAGIGLESIARATLPLALFGAADYAPIMGRLARPSLIAQALSPSIGAWLIERLGTESALGIVVGVAVFNVALTLLLFGWTRARTSPSTH